MRPGGVPNDTYTSRGEINAKGMIVFPGEFRMYHQRHLIRRKAPKKWTMRKRQTVNEQSKLMKNIMKKVKTEKTQRKITLKDLRARKEIKGGQNHGRHIGTRTGKANGQSAFSRW